MRKLDYDLVSLVGKTVDGIFQSTQEIRILFTDGTAICIWPYAEYDNEYIAANIQKYEKGDEGECETNGYKK